MADVDQLAKHLLAGYGCRECFSSAFKPALSTRWEWCMHHKTPPKIKMCKHFLYARMNEKGDWVLGN